MKPLAFDQLPGVTPNPTPPRLPFFDRSGRQIFRCHMSLYPRYSDLRATCERQREPGPRCYCLEGCDA
jgi:hypothetical protein